jgi:hypothetical protein
MAAAAALASDGMAATIGKKELALALGWARTRLDRRLATDPKFPIVSRGDQSGGWQFDLLAVRQYLSSNGKPAAKSASKKGARLPAIDKAQLRNAVAPPAAKPMPGSPRRSAHHEGEATARQRKDAADAALKENKLALETGELVVKSEVRQMLTELFAGLGQDLDAAPEEITKRCELPEDAAPGIRKVIDDIRTSMVKRFEPHLSDG